MYNSSFHHAASLQIPKNIALLFLLPYNPELNFAEKMWRHFKDLVSTVAYNNLEMLQVKISDITNHLNSQLIKSISGNEFYKTTFKTTFNL